DDLRRVAPGGEDDDRDVGRLPDPLADLETVDGGEHEVEDHEDEGSGGEELERRRTVAGGGGAEPRPFEEERRRLLHRRVVIDEEDLAAHAPPRGPRLRSIADPPASEKAPRSPVTVLLQGERRSRRP